MRPRRAVPPGLADFQDDFAGLLRTPLCFASGRLSSDLSGCAPRLLQGTVGDARERLGIYQRQYWMRLFTVLQGELLLTSRLIGAFAFNQLASEYLLVHPPRHEDLGELVAGFAPWLSAQQGAVQGLQDAQGGAAVETAIVIDLAFRRALLSPVRTLWKPSPTEVAALPGRHLRLAEHATLVTERFPLLQTRLALMQDPSPEQVSLGAPCKQDWVILGGTTGVVYKRLSSAQAALYRECSRRRLQDALKVFSAEQPDEVGAGLAGQVQAWFAQSIELGLWSGSVE